MPPSKSRVDYVREYMKAEHRCGASQCTIKNNHDPDKDAALLPLTTFRLKSFIEGERKL